MTQYDRGARFERDVRDMLIKMEAVAVIRSAGSRGLLDLVAWMDNGETWFIQCKLNGKISKEDRDTLRDMAETVGAHAYLAYRDGRGPTAIRLERIDGAVVSDG